MILIWAAILLVMIVIVLFSSALYAFWIAWLEYRLRVYYFLHIECGIQSPCAIDKGKPKSYSEPWYKLSSQSRYEFAQIGLILGGIGLVFTVVGWLMRTGQFAVGIYLGGILCIALGSVVALFGLMVKIMTRNIDSSSIDN